MNFDECFKKHFSLSYSTYSIIAEMSDVSIEEWTLRLVRNYKGDYELEDSLMGAFIMHVAIGNIQGWDLDTLLKKLNWSSDFEYDIKYGLNN